MKTYTLARSGKKMRNFFEIKKKIGFGKKSFGSNTGQFRLRSWTLVSVPDTETWFWWLVLHIIKTQPYSRIHKYLYVEIKMLLHWNAKQNGQNF